jgi:hypothetical protein
VGVVHLSGGEWVVAGVLMVVGPVVGYLLSENDRRTLGRTPWGLPSLLWALFWLLSVLLGLVLYLIAHSSGVRRAQHGSPAVYPGPGAAPPGAAGGVGTLSVAEQFPAYPRPANLQPDRSPPQSEAPVESAQDSPGGPDAEGPAAGPAADDVPEAGNGPPAPASPTTWMQSPPAWHPDPSGRFHYRWWDGSQWTSQVSTDGHILIDTNPDQRIGPYH